MPQFPTQNSKPDGRGLKLVHASDTRPLRVACSGLAVELAPHLQQLLRKAGAQLSLDTDTAADNGHHGFVLDRWRGAPAATEIGLYPIQGLPGTLKGLAPRLSLLVATLPRSASADVILALSGLAGRALPEQPRIVVVDQPLAADILAQQYPLAEVETLSTPDTVDTLLASPDRIDLLVLPELLGPLFARLALGLAGTRDVSLDLRTHGGALHVGHRAETGGEVEPAALVLSAVWLLLALGRPEAAETLHNAVLKTLEEGVHTNALEPLNPYSTWVVPERMIEAIEARLGQKPRRLEAVRYTKEAGAVRPGSHLKRVV